MRLTLFLPTLAFFALFPLLASSLHPHALANRRDHARSPAPSVIAARQYRFPRDLLDVCINVNANLLADASQLLGLSSILGALNLGADIELCLCLKDLNIYLDTNDSIKALVGLLGKDTVGALVTALINTSPDAQHCTFPPHAHHTCNTSDPCHYACDPPYVSQGDQCVCAPPQTSCNGVCGIFPQGCSSSVPRPLTKRSDLIVSIAQAQASCKSGETVCGIPGREKTLAFECIDTNSTKDSCGGCTTPHPFFETVWSRRSLGMDCSAISNAKTTSCSSSRCVVMTCQEGWTPSSEKDSCVPRAGTRSKMRRVRKRSEAITELDSMTDVGSLITSVVKLVIALNIHAPGTALIDSTNAPSVTDLTNINAVYNLLDGVNAATSGLVSSTSVPLLLAYSGSLLDTCSLLRATLNDCGCISNLGIGSLSEDLDNLIAAVVNLQTVCNQHPNGNIVSSASSTANSSSTSATGASDTPVIVGLTTLLSKLGIHGKSGVVVDGLVSPDTAKSVNGLLDGLGVGPAYYKRQTAPPLTAIVNATLGGNSDLLSQLTVVVNLIVKLAGSGNASPSSTTPAVSSPPSGNAISPIIQSTDSVTSSLATCLIDPILFGTLYRYSLNLADSPDLLSFCKNTGLLYAAECNLRELFSDCEHVDELGLGDVIADLLLALDETRYLESWCATNSNGGNGNGVAVHSAATVIGISSITSAAIAGGVTSDVVPSPTFSATASISSLSIGSSAAGTTFSIAVSSVGPSSSSLIHSPVTTTSPTVTSTHSVTSPSLTTPSVSTVHIPTSSALPTPTLASSTATYLISSSRSTLTAAPPSNTPIVVSLDDVLSNLGLNGTTAVVTVDGLLGNQLNGDVNQVLNGVGIGPSNVRRRDQERRQIVANANATINVGGLGGTVDALVNLVLGLKVAGDSLSSVTTSLVTPLDSASIPSSIPSLPLAPLPDLPLVSEHSSSLVSQAFVNNVLTATIALLSLSSPTYAQFLQALDELVASSTQSMGMIGGCSCASVENGLEEVYQYLVQITEAAEELGDLCRNEAGPSADGPGAQAHSPPAVAGTATTTAAIGSSSATSIPSGDEPIIVGLTKLLKGLGLDINGDVVVDGLLGNEADHTVNTILNGLGIGPNGARRRGLVQRERSDW